MKTVNIDEILPLYLYEDDFLISKNTDITALYEVVLPEVWTLTQNDYENQMNCWIRAMKSLPDFSILHKQDVFIEKKYHSKGACSGYLAKGYANHFEGRLYYDHKTYLYVTLSCKDNIKKDSTLSCICSGNIVAKDMTDEKKLSDFSNALLEMKNILEGVGIKLRRLTEEEVVGSQENFGLIEKYLNLDFSESNTSLKEQHILNDDTFMVGDSYVSCFAISDLQNMPNTVATHSWNPALSQSSIGCYVNQSYVEGLCLLTKCEHIYNQYFFLEPQEALKEKIKSQGKLLRSMSGLDSDNKYNSAQNEMFLDQIAQTGDRICRSAFNVIMWDQDYNSLLKKNAALSEKFSKLDCTNTKVERITPHIFWGGIPGCANYYPAEMTLLGTTEQNACFIQTDSNYKDWVNPETDYHINMCDRVNGVPVAMDLDEKPMEWGWINNRNKVMVGPSGSGKSFFINNLLRQMYDQEYHEVIVDIGNSYQGLYEFIKEETNGKDGLYYTYSEDHPLSFNPFYDPTGRYSEEKKEQLVSLILTLWKSDTESVKKSEISHIEICLNNYFQKVKNKDVDPSFDSFYEYLKGEYTDYIKNEVKVERDNFDIDNLVQILVKFYKDGPYGKLLNSDMDDDLLNNRFIIFELDKIKDNKTLLPIVTLLIMNTFTNKMFNLPKKQYVDKDGSLKEKEVGKILLMEEAWSALKSENMANYIGYLYRTARKHYAQICIVTQEPSDLVGNKNIEDIVSTQSPVKILLDFAQYKDMQDKITRSLGLTKDEIAKLMSVNQNLQFKGRNRYKEAFIKVGERSAVYATEVSKEEALAYSTEKKIKSDLMSLKRTFQLTMAQAIEKKLYNKLPYEEEN